jgi:hypothetical protein
LGNHGYSDGGGISVYLNYFTVPNNERYYDKIIGDVHLFVININRGGRRQQNRSK